MNEGVVFGIIGVALCVLLCGLGSALGLYFTSSAAAGVTGEEPKKFGKVMLLVLLPATQGLYGFIIGILSLNALGDISTAVEGWRLFGAVLPMAISGLATAILQGKSSSKCIYAVAKQDSLSGKLLLFPAMIEFYAILGLVISIMAI